MRFGCPRHAVIGVAWQRVRSGCRQNKSHPDNEELRFCAFWDSVTCMTRMCSPGYLNRFEYDLAKRLPWSGKRIFAGGRVRLERERLFSRCSGTRV